MRIRLILFVLLLAAGGGMVAACAAPTPSSSEAAPAAASQPTQLPPESTPSMNVEANAEEDTVGYDRQVSVETMQFDGQGTFLDWVNGILTGEGEATSRYFVEVTDSAGVDWQGERLRYAEQEVWLLQPAQRGGGLGVRVNITPVLESDAQDSVVYESVTAHLPAIDGDESAAPDVEIRFVRARLQNDRWSFDVTLAHPDTGWEDYADGWQIETPDGEILAVRILLHPHETEQPFTSSQGGVVISAGVDEVVVRTHDLVSGYGPGALRIQVAESVTTDAYEVIR